MDIDTGTYFPPGFFGAFLFLMVSFPSETPSSVQDRTKKVRLLPYFLVPGMDIHSRIFHKAQATIAKQVAAASVSKSTSTEPLFDLQKGMASYFNLLFYNLD